jgi:hypothetical protein
MEAETGGVDVSSESATGSPAVKAGQIRLEVVPLDVLADTIRPFPTFSEIYVAALKSLRGEIAAASKAVGTGPPMAS